MFEKFSVSHYYVLEVSEKSRGTKCVATKGTWWLGNSGLWLAEYVDLSSAIA